MKIIFSNNIKWDGIKLKILSFRTNLLILLAFAVFFVGYGCLCEVENKEKNIGGYASAEIQECGCYKCHSIKLKTCNGCHNSQNDTKNEDTTNSNAAFEEIESDTYDSNTKENNKSQLNDLESSEPFTKKRNRENISNKNKK